MKKLLILLALFIFANPCFAIKIGLMVGTEDVPFGTSVKGAIIDVNTNRTQLELTAMKGYEIKPYNNVLAIKIDGTFYKIDSDNIVIKPLSEGYVCTKSKWYRGFLRVQNKGGKLTVINDVDIEDYIRGVVPAEMPPSWEIEAHKAQAVAARSYAIANLGKRANLGFDLKDTPEDQAYGGASAETPMTNKAVDETNGIVLTHDMKVITAYYSASAGGQSVTASDVWGGNLPYLRSVPSFDGNVKKNGHGVGMSQHGANNLAKQGYNGYQILQYFYKDVTFARLNPEYYNR